MKRKWISKTLVFILILILTSCNNKSVEQKLFNKALEDYITKNPSGTHYEIENGIRTRISTPSYHLFFNKKGAKDEMIVKLAAFYTNLAIASDFEDINNDGFNFKFKEQNAKGYFIYKNKYPVIVFDTINISYKYLPQEIKTIIPDSLKFSIDTPTSCGNLKSDTILYRFDDSEPIKI